MMYDPDVPAKHTSLIRATTNEFPNFLNPWLGVARPHSSQPEPTSIWLVLLPHLV
jgi:hypothetical protein